MQLTKAEIRAEVRARRALIGHADRPAIAVPAEFRRLLSAGLVVAGYVPMRDEADPSALIDAARDRGCIIALPRVEGRSTHMDFRRAAVGVAIERSPFGMNQPQQDAPAIAPDIILVPLMAFARSGARLGHGAGHYDRALAHSSATKIGVAWARLEYPGLPQDPWDVRLDAIITEREWICV